MENLKTQIEKNSKQIIDVLNENMLHNLQYAISHNGNFIKVKYYEQDFAFCPWIDKNDFYWNDKEKCYYKKGE